MLDRNAAALSADTAFQRAGVALPCETADQRARRIFLDREQPAPLQELHAVADEWRRLHSLPTPNLPWQHLYVTPARADAVAAAHAALPTTPTLEARIAFDEFARQVDRQFSLVEQLGVRVSFVDDPEPYPSAGAQAMDVAVNNHIAIATIACWPEAYHPLLSNERGGSYDRYRAVHDLFGHVAIGTGFDRHGEFAAWLHHSTMFFGPAQRAVTTELHGETMTLASTGQVATHKAGLLPEAFSPLAFFHRGVQP